ncbi:hypothetical protein [Ralstonia mannitolilytica]|uniref:hypothetical protein n=1 Tax=Ralstonia mannitolilytica TaxID=105219 RepID=UPI0007B006FB|nr:hypothetical protein [Ralstonia mannitolilytica]ANA34311.1 hypothetical protein VZ52_13405 [Ralstonia mannitolilytica]
MSAAPKTSDIAIHVRRVFPDGSEATFDTTASTLIDAVAAAQHLAGTVTLSASADLPKVTPPASTKTTKAESSPTPAPAPAAAAATEKSDGGDNALDYEKDIKPKVLKLAAEKGRDATAATMARFGVKKAPELNKSQWPEFVRFIDRVLSGEIDPMASTPREEEAVA